ncbi:ferrochelatase [Gammaproteobacteria bacterium]|jgi:ferrochelatase|nr:ferrochelatase [Pseudomonadota bacterium]MDA9835210.1 ferrochelatase [Gammaproteobacteria bacterium]MDO7702195.1 ferrochelatase [SAR86 cluster bacterium]MDA9917499.1 ferrochelatase [Gammaproteobacteria bacterium]MDA9978823.1 ferrochelatase [Gammaproteobacteria bacterium]
MNKPALLIVNLGTPDSPSYFNVFKYLREFLMDGRVIDIPAFFRFILVTLIICPLRSFSSGKIYKQLWDLSGGESPLLKNTRELTTKLNEAQEKFNVFYAMRYQTPSIKSTLAHIQKTNPTDLIVFPLFPHYASATSGSVYAEVTKQLSKEWVIPNFNFISQYYDHPAFIEAWIKTAQNYDIEQYDKILFSYHGLPKSQVNKVYKDMQCDGKNCEHEINDDNHYCYKATVYETSKLIADRLNIPQDKYEVSFQSRLTNNWLEPFSDEVLKSYPAKGIKKVLVFSPAFTADCLETIIEIGHEYKELFEESGGQKLDYVESLNFSDAWVQAIIEIVNSKSG